MLNIFNLSLQLNGFPIKEAKKQLDEILEIHESKYEQYLETKKNCRLSFRKQYFLS